MPSQQPLRHWEAVIYKVDQHVYVLISEALVPVVKCYDCSNDTLVQLVLLSLWWFDGRRRRYTQSSS